MADLSGKVALVTGGTSGIGEAVVKKFSEEGAMVIFTGNNVKAAEKICAETNSKFVRQDVSDPSSWEAVMAAVESEGRLDVVFANAGINKGDSDIEDVELDAWNNLLAVNLTGVMLACKHGIAAMKKNPDGPSGSIVINSSVVGKFGLPGDVAYTATKGAVAAMMKSVAVHCASRKYNIRCNSIHPGIVETPNIVRAMEEGGDPEAARAFLESASPMRRLGKVEEIAELVAFVASDKASFVTGSELVIDGGSTAGFMGV